MDTVRCPHCGAAWTGRPRNFCEFCGTAVAPGVRGQSVFASGVQPPPLPTTGPPAPPPPPARASSSFEPPHVPPLPTPPLPSLAPASTLGTSASGPPPAGTDTGQFSSSPATALKVVLVSLAISLLPCCGIGFAVLVALYFVLGMNRR
jgi:hypothetical protein